MTPDQIRETLESFRIRVTAQRLEIASVMLDQHQHLSADEVLCRVKDRGQHVSKATVYNTLNLFSRKGLLREVLIDPSRVFYDSNATHHHHFYNVDTGDLIDVAPGEVDFAALPSAPDGMSTDGIEVIIRLRAKQSSDRREPDSGA